MEQALMDTLILSRIQFAANISFHILFPSITIALCWILFYFKCRYDFSRNPVWMRAYRFWVKVFALTFALGVVSGITMSFQFGTNWPGFMETVGNIAGPLLGYEVLTAFFLEATFLGIMLFGIHRVPNRVHTIATLLVAVGTTLSAFWILALNSWMQTPVAYEVREGVLFPSDWWEIIFNPSFPYRFSHVLIASGLTAGFMVAGISAYRLLKGDTKRAPRLALKSAVVLIAVLAPLQAFVGDLHGLNTLEYQPPVKPVFYGFRVMVGLGVSMILLSWFAIFTYLRRKKLSPLLLKIFVGMTFSGWVATLAGWYVTEIGRQPYIVSGILKTADAVTTVAPSNVIFSLTMYLTVYGFLLCAYIHTVFAMARRAVNVEEYETEDPKIATVMNATSTLNTFNKGVKI